MMPDMEKAITGLQIERECVSRDCDRDCGECDLVQDREWLLSVYDDAIELLKEQEPIKPKSKVRHGENGQIQHWCGNCMAMLHGKPKYCSNCGRQVKWE